VCMYMKKDELSYDTEPPYDMFPAAPPRHRKVGIIVLYFVYFPE